MRGPCHVCLRLSDFKQRSSTKSQNVWLPWFHKPAVGSTTLRSTAARAVCTPTTFQQCRTRLRCLAAIHAVSHPVRPARHLSLAACRSSCHSDLQNRPTCVQVDIMRCKGRSNTAASSFAWCEALPCLFCFPFTAAVLRNTWRGISARPRHAVMLLVSIADRAARCRPTKGAWPGCRRR